MRHHPYFGHGFQRHLNMPTVLPLRRAFLWLRSLAVVVGFLSLLWMVGCSGGYTPGNNNPMPTVSSVNPNSATAGNAAFMLSVSGAGFISSSTVQWNGSARVTTYVSTTQLQAAITAADVANAGTASVTVSNPAPGGGVSSGVVFTTDNPPPTLSSLNPISAFAGSPGFNLNLTGTNFVSASSVLWNGSPRPTTFVSSTQLQATIPATDIAVVGSALLTVSNPAPGGGVSGSSTFTIAPPPPTISQLTPSSAIAASAGFTLNVSGTNFVNSSAVQWNGSPRTTTFVSATQLQAAITAADIAAIGVSHISVSNPAGSGGNSNPSTFFTGSFGGPGYAVVLLNQDSKDLVYDPTNQVIYLSVPGSAANNPNSISVLRLSNASIVSSTAAGSQPNVLAISDDSKFLYAGIDGSSSVQRFTLPGLAKDISYPLGANPTFGNYFALDIQVAPATPRTTAVTLANVGFSPSAQGGITIFDDATPRPTTVPGFSGTGNLFDSLQWGFDSTALYAVNNEDTAFDFYTLTVNSIAFSIGRGNPVRLVRWGQNGLAFITDGGQVGLVGGNFIH